MSQPGHSYEHWVRSLQAQMVDQRASLRTRDPRQVARQSGAQWEPAEDGGGRLALHLWRAPLSVRVPAYTVHGPDEQDIAPLTAALVIAYLDTACGTPRAGKWIAYRELPGGMFYHQAFTGYTGAVLARELRDDLAAFKRGAVAHGGEVLTVPGDAAYSFHVLPGIWLAVAYWLGDDEDGFPSQAAVLFDAAASDYLPVDGLAILAGQLSRRILAAAREAG